MGDNQRSLQQPAFNLTEQSGVLAALLAVRTSELPAAEKNDLRDQIFTYTKSGGDERLREQVEQKLADLPLSEQFIEQQQAKQKTESQAGFAGARRTPSFSVRSTAAVDANAASAPAPEPDPASTTKQAAPAPTEESQSTVTPAAALQTPPAAAPTPTPQEPSAPAPTPQEPPAPTAAPQTPVESDESAGDTTTTPPAESQTPSPASSSTPQEPTIERIREVKRYINNAVGNPVNLVDIDSQVGRSYMSALLAAMQSVNAETGRAGDGEMQQLETVFAQVKQLLATQDSAAPANEDSAAPTQPAAEPTPTPEPVPQPEASTPPKEPTPPTPSAPPEPPAATAETGTAPAAEPTAAPDPVPAKRPIQPQDGATSKSSASTEPTVSPTIRSVAADAAADQAERRQAATTPHDSQADTPAPPPQSEAVTPPPEAAAPKATPTAAPVSSLGTESEDAPAPPEPSFAPQPVEDRGPRTDGPTQSVVPPIYGAEDQAATPTNLTASVSEEPSAPVQSTAPNENATAAPTPPAPASAPEPSAAATGQVGAATQASAQADDTIAGKLRALDAQAAQNQYAGDPLYAPEVDAGLQQLLLEWNLFKSSGLFGTGPNGREHPLFKKLAPMMVQDVASGRFDDARPDVVQSITDYMNGWRYEQGVVYEPGESFEKYLRRVIRFILDSKG